MKQQSDVFAEYKDRTREEWQSMTPAQAAMEARAMATKLHKAGVPQARTSRMPETHAQKVTRVRREAITQHLNAERKRRETAELKRAADAGKRYGFNNHVEQAEALQKARDSRLDAEADAAERRAMGLSADGTVGKADVLAQYEAMPTGRQREEFYAKHRVAIFKAMNRKDK